MVFFYPNSAKGAFESEILSPLQNAAGGAPFSMNYSPLSIVSDPTGLAKAPSLFYAGSLHQKFGLKSLKESLFIVGGNFRGVGLGLGLSKFGNSNYQELLVSAMGAKQVKDALQLSFSFNIYQLNIENYGQALAFGSQLTLRYILNNLLESRFSVLNANRPTIGESKEKLPQIITAGLFIKPSERIFAQVSLVQDTEYPVSIRFGIIFKMMDQLGFAIGKINQPNVITTGGYINWKNFQIELGCLSYVDLGLITYQTGISFTRNP